MSSTWRGITQEIPKSASIEGDNRSRIAPSGLRTQEKSRWKWGASGPTRRVSFLLRSTPRASVRPRPGTNPPRLASTALDKLLPRCRGLTSAEPLCLGTRSVMFIHPADPTQNAFWNVHPQDDEIFRVAILSTPRAGSTWLRRLLNSVYSMPQVVLDNPVYVDWEQLPRRCIMQLHWKCDPALVFTLKTNGFRLLTVCRHPLDVLISILHFSSVHAGTSSWLDGRGGDERAIAEATPCSAEFLDYAVSMRADILLSVSRHWKTVEDCLLVRYEDLVEEPAAGLKAVCDWLRPAPAEAIQYAIGTNTLAHEREGNANQHFWRGKPDQWKRLLPARPVQDRRSSRAAFPGVGLRVRSGSQAHPGAGRCELVRFGVRLVEGGMPGGAIAVAQHRTEPPRRPVRGTASQPPAVAVAVPAVAGADRGSPCGVGRRAGASFAPCRQISSLTTATGGPLSPRARHIAGEWRQNELHWRGRPRRYRGRTAFPFPPG